MGKSDSLLFPLYQDFLKRHLSQQSDPIRIAFLGFSGHNDFTRSFLPNECDFYDIQLDNWNIKQCWELKRNDYDLIICTRCAYFTEPKSFVAACIDHLRSGGHAFIDWGLGDHWRFPDFRVGWMDERVPPYSEDPPQMEYAVYADQRQYLVGCAWSDELETHPETVKFRKLIRKKGPRDGSHPYDDERTIAQIIDYEVLCNLDLKTLPCLKAVETVCLWPDDPQLYILTLLQRIE